MLWFRHGSSGTKPPGNPVLSEKRLWPRLLADSLAEMNFFGALTVRTSAGKSSSSSFLTDFSSVVMEISSSFLW